MRADVRRRSSAWIGVHRRFPTLGGMRSARYELRISDCGLRIELENPKSGGEDLTWVMAGTAMTRSYRVYQTLLTNCGFSPFNPQSEIRNPQSEIRNRFTSPWRSRPCAGRSRP